MTSEKQIPLKPTEAQITDARKPQQIIADEAYKLVEAYNNIIEANMIVNKPLGYEHISTKEQNEHLSVFRDRAVFTIAYLIEQQGRTNTYGDVEKYETENKVKTMSHESYAIARAVFEVQWLRYLVIHCGKRKFGWYNRLIEYLTPIMDSTELYAWYRDFYPEVFQKELEKLVTTT